MTNGLKQAWGESEALRRIEAERAARTGRLDLGGLGLERLPPALFELTWLWGLNLGRWSVDARGQPTWTHSDANHLTALPGELGRLADLRRLIVDDNPLIDLGAVQQLRALQHLDCARTGVVELGPLAGLSALQTLDCSHTRVVELRPLAGLSALQTLNCSGTGVVELGPLAGLSALQTLDCSRTGVVELRPLAGLSALQTLNCAATGVVELGPLAALSALQTLYFALTGVVELEPLAGLSALQTLDCSDTGVVELGPLAGLSALQTLNCSFTGVVELGPLAELLALQTLDCWGTGVVALGPLAGLSALQTLDCSHTRVVELRPLAGLSALQTLNCSGTGVVELGPLAGLSALQTLDCSETGVVELGPLAGLTALQSLDCSQTGVVELGPLVGLSALQRLGCSDTGVVELPRGLVDSPSLTDLYLYDTRIRELPPEVLSQWAGENCLPRIRAHLADLDAGAEPLRTTKLIVLGNGRVGKTQLCRRLRGMAYDAQVPSTHGITLASTPFGDDGEMLNLWDFGGQDIYHGAHALFMRTRAVFVIAWHPDFEASPTHVHEGMTFENRRLAYWLAFVQAMGAAGSPVIAVQCQAEVHKQAARTLPADPALLDALGVMSVAYSARTDRGRGGLDDAITDAIAMLRQRDGLASIGIGRARVVERLMAWRAEDEPRPPAERQHRTMTTAAFAELCETIGGVSSPAALLHYLHHCGLVYHDPDFFAGQVLLDLTWALDAIYAVFDRHTAWRHLQATHGRFQRAQLAATVWQAHSVEEQRLFLRLMRSCGICFRHGQPSWQPESDDDEYIAPDLLPDETRIADQLAGRWQAQAPTHALTYDYAFLHPGLLRGLMSSIGEAAQGTGVYWRTGLWLYTPSSDSRVRIDCAPTEGHGGRLTVRMQGDDGTLADWLRENIADQHRRYAQPDLAPTLDELPSAARAAAHRPASVEPEVHVDATPPAPAFAPLPPEAFTRPEPDRPHVFISYARDDGTPQAAASARAAAALVVALSARGCNPHIDYTDTQIGDRLSAFMDRLIAGDFIFVILGERYLRSEYCMHELFGIWQRTQRDPARFLGRVIPILLPGTDISTIEARVTHAEYWHERHEVYQATVSKKSLMVAPEDFVRSKQVAEYRMHIASLLYLLADRLIPRDLAHLEATNFADVIDLVTQPPV